LRLAKITVQSAGQTNHTQVWCAFASRDILGTAPGADYVLSLTAIAAKGSPELIS